MAYFMVISIEPASNATASETDMAPPLDRLVRRVRAKEIDLTKVQAELERAHYEYAGDGVAQPDGWENVAVAYISDNEDGKKRVTERLIRLPVKKKEGVPEKPRRGRKPASATAAAGSEGGETTSGTTATATATPSTGRSRISGRKRRGVGGRVGRPAGSGSGTTHTCGAMAHAAEQHAGMFVSPPNMNYRIVNTDGNWTLQVQGATVAHGLHSCPFCGQHLHVGEHANGRGVRMKV